MDARRWSSIIRAAIVALYKQHVAIHHLENVRGCRSQAKRLRQCEAIALIPDAVLHRCDGGFKDVRARLAALRQTDAATVEYHRQLVLRTREG